MAQWAKMTIEKITLILAVVAVCFATIKGEYFDVRDLDEKFRGSGDLDAWTNAILLPNPDKPIEYGGMVEGWRYYGKRVGEIVFQVWRKGKYSGYYKLIGQTVHRNTRVDEHTVMLPETKQFFARAGDVIGIYFPSRSVIPFVSTRSCSGTAGYTLYHRYPRRAIVQPGVELKFTKKLYSWRPCRKYDVDVIINVNVEDDCGSDSKRGPFSMYCLRKVWHEAGCNSSGTGSPDNSEGNTAAWNKMTLGEVKQDMALYKQYTNEGKKNEDGTSYHELCLGKRPARTTSIRVKRRPKLSWLIRFGGQSGAGPHKMEQLQQWWEEAGCYLSAPGSPLNSAGNVRWWNARTPAHVKSNMAMQKRGADADRVNKRGVPYRLLCYGDYGSDVCGYDTKPGPHDKECLYKLWEEIGCNEVGLGGPANSPENILSWNKKSVEKVRFDMQKYKSRADLDKKREDGVSYKDLCYGIRKEATCGVSGVVESQISLKIYGGKTVTDNTKWPWMVSLQKETNNFHFCGGVLIDTTWVLTAAHCVSSFRTSWDGKIVVMGSTDLSRSETHRIKRKIKDIKVHPDYVLKRFPFHVSNDVALIELESPVTYNPHVQPVCLPDLNGPEFTNCQIVGWGRKSTYGSTGGKLQENEATPIPDSTCYNLWKEHKSMIMGNHTMCVQGADRGRICKGDSGGPLLCQQGGNNWVTIGAASWAPTRCSFNKKPFAYARLTHFLEWVRRECGNCF